MGNSISIHSSIHKFTSKIFNRERVLGSTKPPKPQVPQSKFPFEFPKEFPQLLPFPLWNGPRGERVASIRSTLRLCAAFDVMLCGLLLYFCLPPFSFCLPYTFPLSCPPKVGPFLRLRRFALVQRRTIIRVPMGEFGWKEASSKGGTTKLEGNGRPRADNSNGKGGHLSPFDRQSFISQI
jgi:hypothetical protein